MPLSVSMFPGAYQTAPSVPPKNGSTLPRRTDWTPPIWKKFESRSNYFVLGYAIAYES